MSRHPSASEPYTQRPSIHQPVDSDDDDPDDPHQPLHVTSSTNLTDRRFSMSPDSPHHQPTGSDSAIRQVMEHSGNSSPGSPYQGFDWHPIPTGRHHSEPHSPPVRTPEQSGATRASGGGNRASDLEILLEGPTSSPPPEFNTHSRGHRSANSSLGSIATTFTRDGMSSSSRRSGHRSITTPVSGDKAFKSPIILKGGSSLQLRTLSPQEIIDQRSQMTATWGIYWYLPSMMIAVFLAGVLGAVGHHVFYRSLHGKRSESQLSMVRIGTAFAFFVKANLVGAVVLAYR